VLICVHLRLIFMFMKTLLCIVTFLFTSQFAFAQWIKQTVDTTASLRGLSVVNEKIVWASGTGGTVIRTIDGGKTWKVMTVAGAEKLDFRDVEAFDANTAYILSIGNGESSRIYKTTDGGATWKEQFRNKNEKAFYDAMACWDRNNCIAMSDPVDGKFVLINTKDGGATWRPMDTDKMPPAKDGEAAFAASGTCIITQGKNNVFLVTGGNAARVFRSNNRGISWFVADTPIVKGTAGSGIFSIAMRDSKNGVIVGGNYEKPSEISMNFAFTMDIDRMPKTYDPVPKSDRAKYRDSWGEAKNWMTGYRSAVAYIDSNTIIVVGPSGTDIALEDGVTLKNIGDENLNAVAAKGKNAVWAVGPKGMVVKLK
jgi:photosystem II stability/assembly factor-like uncharacterized protein